MGVIRKSSRRSIIVVLMMVMVVMVVIGIGAEDSPKTLSEVHAMLTTLLRHFNVPLPTTRNEGDAKPKRVRRVKSKMITLSATPAARGLQPVIQYILTELPHIIQEILR